MIPALPSTGFAPLDWFLLLLWSWGYPIIFGFTIFENLFVVGTLTPGETVVIFGGLVAARKAVAPMGDPVLIWGWQATREGLHYLAGIWISSVLGTIVGSNTSYWLGRRAGIVRVRAFVEKLSHTRIGRLLRIDAAGLDDVQQHFDDHGSKTVLISRFAVAAKNFVPAIAGAVRMPVFWYELYTVLGAMIYTTLMITIGWFLGENMDEALTVARNISYAGLVFLLIFIGIAYWAGKRIRRRHQLQVLLREEAEAAEHAVTGADADVAGPGDVTD